MTLDHSDLLAEATFLGKIPPRYDLVCAVNKLLRELEPDWGLVPASAIVSDRGGIVIFGDGIGDKPDKVHSFRVEFYNKGHLLFSVTLASGEIKECIAVWK